MGIWEFIGLWLQGFRTVWALRMSKIDCQMIEHTPFDGFENQRTSSLVCEIWHVLREGPTRCGPLLGAEFKNHLKTSCRHAPFTLHYFSYGFLIFPNSLP